MGTKWENSSFDVGNFGSVGPINGFKKSRPLGVVWTNIRHSRRIQNNPLWERIRKVVDSSWVV